MNGNPLRQIGQNGNVRVDSSNLVVDDIYVLDLLQESSVTTSGVGADPRFLDSKEPSRVSLASKQPPPDGCVFPAELGGEDKLDDLVLRFDFDRRQSLNRLSFEIFNVPCNFSVWYFSSIKDEMVQMTNIAGDPVGGVLYGWRQRFRNSEEAVRIHPDGWQQFRWRLPRYTTTRIEIRLDRRMPQRLLPTLVTGHAIPYSLAVRNVRMRYVISKREEIPPPNEDVIYHDPLNNVIRLDIRNWDATRAIDASTETFWKCEPQPISDSVVALYLDVRDGSLNPQLVDRLQIQPLFPGPAMNIYWTDDQTIPTDPTGTSEIAEVTKAGDPRLGQRGRITSYFDSQTQWLRFDDGNYVAYAMSEFKRIDPDLMVWAPIHRDYELTAGTIHLPPTRATYLKLEFTDLVQQPYPVWEEKLIRVVKKYPQTIVQYYAAMSLRTKSSPHEPPRRGDLFEHRDRKHQHRHRRSRLQELLEGGARIVDPTRYEALHARHHRPRVREDVEVDLEHHVVRKRFHRKVRHEYSYYEVEQKDKVAYFVGIADLKVYRVDYTKPEDTPEYIETFRDAKNVQTNTFGTKDPNGPLIATGVGQLMETKRLESFSNFRSLQLAVVDSGWRTSMTNDQLDIVTDSHLTNRANTTRTDATEALVGNGLGKVLQFEATAPGAIYGVKLLSGVTILAGAKSSVVARIFLPETAGGTYELRLVATGGGDGATVHRSQRFKLTAQKWYEIEMLHEQGGTFDAHLVQVDTAVSEPFSVDFFGIFEHDIKWEVTNDDGTNWFTIGACLNNPKAAFTFPTSDKRLKIRATALRSGVAIGGFHAVPWYIGSPLVTKVPIDVVPPWGHSEMEELRAPIHKPAFQAWSHWYPPQHSLERYRLYGA